MIDLKELKALAERVVEVAAKEIDQDAAIELSDAYTDFYEKSCPLTILKLLEVIRVQGEALEYVAGARCERHMCTCYRDSTIIAISKTQKILGGE